MGIYLGVERYDSIRADSQSLAERQSGCEKYMVFLDLDSGSRSSLPDVQFQGRTWPVLQLLNPWTWTWLVR
jgi:hypothetical protein